MLVSRSAISQMFSGCYIMHDTTNKTLALNFNNAYPLLLLFSNINICNTLTITVDKIRDMNYVSKTEHEALNEERKKKINLVQKF